MALCNRGLGVPGFFERAGRLVARRVAWDGCCWFTLDPATNLPTSHVAFDSIRAEDVPRLADNEYRRRDVNKFVTLATGRERARMLSAATGVPQRSARWREILRPNGFAHELRVAFAREGLCWGGLALYRHGDQPDFDPAESRFLAGVAGEVAEASAGRSCWAPPARAARTRPGCWCWTTGISRSQ